MANPEYYEDLKWLLLRLQRAEQYCQEYFDRGKRWYRLWRFGSAVDEKDWPYVNRVRTKDIFAFCEDTTALMMSTLLATMPFYSIIPRETSMFMKMFTGIDPSKIGEQLERCLAYQVEHEDTEFFEEITDFIKNGDVMGTSYMGVYPKFINKRYLRPLLRGHDYWDVMPVPRGSRLSRVKGLFLREFNTLEDLEMLQRQGVYRNVARLTSDVKTGMTTEWHKQLLQELGMEAYVIDEENKEILHYFSGGHVITFADRKVILRDSRGSSEKPLPYDLPLVQYKFIPVPYEFFGMGIPEVLEVLQEDRNLIRSARRDNIDMTINKILKIKMGSDLNIDLIKPYPNAMWPVNEMDDIEEMQMTDISQSAYNEEQLISRDQENAMSMFGYARGMTPSHSEQPTTVMKLQQASLNRLDLSVKLAEFGFFQKIGTRIILLTRRFMDQETYEEIIGEPDAGFFQLSEDQIRRFYYVKPVGSSITHIKELRQQHIQFAINLLMGLQQNPMAAGQFQVNWYKAAKVAMEASDVPDANEIIIPTQQQASPLEQFPMPNPAILQALAGQPYSEGGM